MDPIHLDHAACTPLEPAAREAMIDALAGPFAHPGSTHGPGRMIRARLDRARVEVAEYLACAPDELRWWPSASAALAAAVAEAAAHGSGAIVTSAIEHPAVHDAIAPLARPVRMLPLRGPCPDATALAASLADAAVIVLTALDHELGTPLAIPEWLALAPGAWWVIDAVQAAAWIDLQGWWRPRVFVVASAPKLGGPAGAAVLRVPPELAGTDARAGERLHAPGGPDVIAAIGFGAACRVRTDRRAAALERAARLGAALRRGLLDARDDGLDNAGPTALGPIVDVGWAGLLATEVQHVMDLENVAIGRTAACRQRLDARSSVIAAAYPDEPWRAAAATRWSLGWHSTEADVREALARFARQFGRARA